MSSLCHLWHSRLRRLSPPAFSADPAPRSSPIARGRSRCSPSMMHANTGMHIHTTHAAYIQHAACNHVSTGFRSLRVQQHNKCTCVRIHNGTGYGEYRSKTISYRYNIRKERGALFCYFVRARYCCTYSCSAFCTDCILLTYSHNY